MKCSKSIHTRVKKVNGQVTGILKMMEDERDCSDIINQLAAVRASVDKVIALIATQNLMQSIEDSYDIKLDNFDEELDILIRSR